MVKQKLEFTAEIKNFDDDVIYVEITDATQDGPIISMRYNSERIRMTRKELDELVCVFDMYERARGLLSEVKT